MDLFFRLFFFKWVKSLAKGCAWSGALNHWLWTVCRLTNDDDCLHCQLLLILAFCNVCVCGKCATLCVFVDFDTFHSVANSACTSNNQQNWKNKTTTILFHKRPIQGCTEWHCGHADANYVVFSVSWFCTLLPVSCAHVGHTKKCTCTKSGKTRQRFVFCTNGFQ